MTLRMLCMHESRGGSWCRLERGHGGLHSDLVLLWDAEGFLCNAEGRNVEEGGR